MGSAVVATLDRLSTKYALVCAILLTFISLEHWDQVFAKSANDGEYGDNPGGSNGGGYEGQNYGDDVAGPSCPASVRPLANQLIYLQSQPLPAKPEAFEDANEAWNVLMRPALSRLLLTSDTLNCEGEAVLSIESADVLMRNFKACRLSVSTVFSLSGYIGDMDYFLELSTPIPPQYPSLTNNAVLAALLQRNWVFYDMFINRAPSERTLLNLAAVIESVKVDTFPKRWTELKVRGASLDAFDGAALKLSPNALSVLKPDTRDTGYREPERQVISVTNEDDFRVPASVVVTAALVGLASVAVILLYLIWLVIREMRICRRRSIKDDIMASMTPRASSPSLDMWMTHHQICQQTELEQPQSYFQSL